MIALLKEGMVDMEFELNSAKTYATEENARKTVKKLGFNDLRHFITCNKEGRFFPVFVGQEALQAGVHFHFTVVG